MDASVAEKSVSHTNWCQLRFCLALTERSSICPDSHQNNTSVAVLIVSVFIAFTGFVFPIQGMHSRRILQLHAPQAYLKRAEKRALWTWTQETQQEVNNSSVLCSFHFRFWVCGGYSDICLVQIDTVVFEDMLPQEHCSRWSPVLSAIANRNLHCFWKLQLSLYCRDLCTVAGNHELAAACSQNGLMMVASQDLPHSFSWREVMQKFTSLSSGTGLPQFHLEYMWYKLFVQGCTE